MQNKITNNIFASTCWKYYEANDVPKNSSTKNLVHGIHNARNILKGLERSLKKSSKYERQLLSCKTSHSHLHDSNEWWSDKGSSKCSKTEVSRSSKTSRRPVDLAESWSTMSIICLQYQYEELSKRYTSLLEEYDKRCTALQAREAALSRLGQRARVTRAQLTHAHRTLLAVGEKYVGMRDRRIAQKVHYETCIEQLKQTVHDVMLASEFARRELDCQIASSMAAESDSATSLLLAEIRKCNLLYLENIRLKAQVEDLAPGQANWEML